MRLLLAGLLLVLMLGLQQLHANFSADLGSRATLAFGFLMMAGFLLGEVLARWVPRITGYLLAGMAFGPHLLGLVGTEVIEHFGLIDELALVLIALTAGAELKVARLRQRIRGILTVALVQTGVVFVAVAGVLWMVADWLPVFSGLTGGQRLAVAGFLGLVAAAKSPSTTVAVIVETGAKGPMTDLVLGVTVLKDILILIGFSLLMSQAAPAFSASVAEQPSLWWLLAEVVLALLGGAAFGGLMILYLRFIGGQAVLFVVASAFLLISLADAFAVDVLLSAVAAGFVVSNFSSHGERFLGSLERASGPIFLVFFCLAGAGLALSALAGLWQAALLYIGLRTLFTWLGTWAGAAAAKEPGSVRRLAWTGFLGQAGVSLGLAMAVRSAFGPAGAPVADLVIAGIVLNQVLGPVAFRWALQRSGEARRQT